MWPWSPLNKLSLHRQSHITFRAHHPFLANGRKGNKMHYMSYPKPAKSSGSCFGGTVTIVDDEKLIISNQINIIHQYTKHKKENFPWGRERITVRLLDPFSASGFVLLMKFPDKWVLWTGYASQKQSFSRTVPLLSMQREGERGERQRQRDRQKQRQTDRDETEKERDSEREKERERDRQIQRNRQRQKKREYVHFSGRWETLRHGRHNMT